MAQHYFPSQPKQLGKGIVRSPLPPYKIPSKLEFHQF